MRRRKYTYEFILSIINEHIETGAGSKVLGSKYGINDARIAEWLKEYVLMPCNKEREAIEDERKLNKILNKALNNLPT